MLSDSERYMLSWEHARRDECGLIGGFICREHLRLSWGRLTRRQRARVLGIDGVMEEAADEYILRVIARHFADARMHHYAVRYYARHRRAVLGGGTMAYPHRTGPCVPEDDDYEHPPRP